MERRDIYLIVGSVIFALLVILFFDQLVAILFGAYLAFFIAFLVITNYRKVIIEEPEYITTSKYQHQ